VFDSWPHSGEISTAIKANQDCGFASGGKVAGIETLIDRLTAQRGEEIKGLLDRYPSDYEWFNDYDFVVRFVIGSFVDRYDDLDADSLSAILDWTCVGPVDEGLIEGVVQEYSEPGTHHFTYYEQLNLIEDWFTGKLQFTEIEGQFNALERLEEIAKNL